MPAGASSIQLTTSRASNRAADGRSVYDLIGSGFTLFAAPHSGLAADFEAAAAQRSLPFTVAAAPFDEVVLVRSDGHIAWRDTGRSDESAGAILDVARGVASASIRTPEGISQ